MEYSEDGIEQLIDTSTAAAEALLPVESLAEAVENVLLALEAGTDNSAETEALIVAYEELLLELGEGETVDINGEAMSASDIETEIDELSELAIQQLAQEELNGLAQDIENYVAAYLDEEDGISYITADLLEGELELWEELQSDLGEGESVEVLGVVYTEDNIDEQVDSLESNLNYLEDNDVVMVIDDGVVTYIDEDEYLAAEELEKQVEEAESLMNLENPTSEDLSNIADELTDVLSLMDEDDTAATVTINGTAYTYSELEDLINKYEADSEALAHQEALDAKAAVITSLLQNNNEVTTDEELTELINKWTDLVDIMTASDTVVVDEQSYTLSEAEEEIEDLEERKENLDVGQVEVTSSSGEITVITAAVTESATVSSDTYEEMTTSSITYEETAPVVSTATSAPAVESPGGEPLTKVTITSPKKTTSTSTSFIQLTTDADPSLERDPDEEPEDDPVLGEEYLVGDNFHILVTTYIQDTAGTGKVYVFPNNHPEDYIHLIEGLEVPTGVCFDKNHNFLYVMDQGNSTATGAIYQHQINWDSKDFELANNIMVEIYNTGNPSDCKVDGYGNLFFTDAQLSTINFVEYSDLYFGYVNMNSVLYSPDETTIALDVPVAIDVVDSENIYYINNGDASIAGTLNEAEAEITATNDEPITVVVTEDITAWGLAYTGDRMYYSLDNGDLKAYEIEEKTTTVYSSGYFIAPRGLCYGDNTVYVTDNGAGILYSIKDGSTKTPKIIVYLQAATSCYCVNESSAAWIGLAVSLLISIIS